MNVAVIGAGPSGLVTTKSLLQAGFSVTCFEAGERAGGQWVIDNTSGTSSAYRSLRTNTNKSMSRYSDYELPEDFPEYPGHTQLADWFHQYAQHFDVLPYIRFSTRVSQVIPIADGRFQVDTEAGGSADFDAVVVACGNLWAPSLPAISGEFHGEQLHTKFYRDPATPIDLRGKRVLVRGLGNSGCEIAVELALENGPGKIFISARSGQVILPRVSEDGPTPPHPADPLSTGLRLMPRWMRKHLFPVIFRRIMTKLIESGITPQQVELPPPPANLLSKRTVVNDQIINLISEGVISAKPDIEKLVGDSVRFADGSTEAIDAIIHATGYRLSLPFLSPTVLGVEDSNDLALYRGVMHPEHNQLFFVGIMRVLCSIWPMSEQQALWIAACLRDEVRLPADKRIQQAAYPILKVPFNFCPFYADDLQSDYRR
ncbi:MAG: NAD(P)-binding domain-containing protein [Pseudomonadota bacterium]